VTRYLEKWSGGSKRTKGDRRIGERKKKSDAEKLGRLLTGKKGKREGRWGSGGLEGFSSEGGQK